MPWTCDPDKSCFSHRSCRDFLIATERELSFNLAAVSTWYLLILPLHKDAGNLAKKSVEPALAHLSRIVAVLLYLELTQWFLGITLTNLSRKTKLIPIDENTSMYVRKLASSLNTKMLTSKKEPTLHIFSSRDLNWCLSELSY